MDKLRLIEEQFEISYDTDDCLFIQLYIWLYYGHFYMVQQYKVYEWILLCIIFSALTNHILPHVTIYNTINYLLKIVLNRDTWVHMSKNVTIACKQSFDNFLSKYLKWM